MVWIDFSCKIRKIFTNMSDKKINELIKLIEENDLNCLKNMQLDINYKNSHGKPLIILAVECCLVKIVQKIINLNADINITNQYGVTALSKAHSGVALTEISEIMLLLIESGASPNLKDNQGNNILIRAVAQRQHELVQLLIDKCLDLNLNTHNDKNIPIFIIAIQNNDIEMVSILCHGAKSKSQLYKYEKQLNKYSDVLDKITNFQANDILKKLLIKYSMEKILVEKPEIIKKPKL